MDRHFFDLKANESAQETQFFAIQIGDVDPSRHFPLKTLFDSVAYRKATDLFAEKTETIRRIDDLQQRFKEVSIPIQLLKTEDRTQVAIVFERVNRMGVELDTLQLLSAWTWNEDFDLLNRFKQLRDDLEEFGFAGVGDNSNLMLSCCAAVLTDDPSPEMLINLPGQTVREEFDRVEQGIRGAIDFLRTQLSVQYLKNLPYPALLLPLCAFFAEPEGKSVKYPSETLQRIKRWFWKSCFTERYTSQTRKTTAADIVEIKKLKDGKVSALGEFDASVGPYFFAGRQFRLASAVTQTFILLLAQKRPRTLLSGGMVDLEKVLQTYNRSEFHHIFPRAYLSELRVPDEQINALVNFCFINSIDNKTIGKKKPSLYKSKMPLNAAELAAVLDSAFCDTNMFDDDFESFAQRRSTVLAAEASRLMGHVSK